MNPLRILRWRLRAILPIGVASVLWGAGPLAAQVESPVPALLETDFLLSVGEVVDRELWRDAESVLGSADETKIVDRSLTQFDLLYVPRVVASRALEIGDLVQFLRLDRRIYDPTTRELLGRLLLPTGAGRVDSLAAETARVRVTSAFHPILRGDFVRVVGEALEAWPAAVSMVGAPGGRIAAFQEEKAIYPPFDLLFLRPEAAASTVPGQVVELYRPGGVREGVELPEIVLGKAMVVRADGPLLAAVTVQLERADLGPGDLYRPVPAGGAD